MRYTSRISKNKLSLTIFKQHVNEKLGIAFDDTRLSSSSSSSSSDCIVVVSQISSQSLFYGSTLLVEGLKLCSINGKNILSTVNIEEEMMTNWDQVKEGTLTLGLSSPDNSPLYSWILVNRKHKQRQNNNNNANENYHQEGKVDEEDDDDDDLSEPVPLTYQPIKGSSSTLSATTTTTTTTTKVPPSSSISSSSPSISSSSTDVVISIPKPKRDKYSKNNNLGLTLEKQKVVSRTLEQTTVTRNRFTITKIDRSSSSSSSTSPFENSKLMVGMEIVILNGISCSSLQSVEEVYRMMYNTTGNTITIVAREKKAALTTISPTFKGPSTSRKQPQQQKKDNQTTNPFLSMEEQLRQMMNTERTKQLQESNLLEDVQEAEAHFQNHHHPKQPKEQQEEKEALIEEEEQKQDQIAQMEQEVALLEAEANARMQAEIEARRQAEEALKVQQIQALRKRKEMTRNKASTEQMSQGKSVTRIIRRRHQQLPIQQPRNTTNSSSNIEKKKKELKRQTETPLPGTKSTTTQTRPPKQEKEPSKVARIVTPLPSSQAENSKSQRRPEQNVKVAKIVTPLPAIQSANNNTKRRATQAIKVAKIVTPLPTNNTKPQATQKQKPENVKVAKIVTPLPAIQSANNTKPQPTKQQKPETIKVAKIVTPLSTIESDRNKTNKKKETKSLKPFTNLGVFRRRRQKDQHRGKPKAQAISYDSDNERPDESNAAEVALLSYDSDQDTHDFPTITGKNKLEAKQEQVAKASPKSSWEEPDEERLHIAKDKRVFSYDSDDSSTETTKDADTFSINETPDDAVEIQDSVLDEATVTEEVDVIEEDDVEENVDNDASEILLVGDDKILVQQVEIQDGMGFRGLYSGTVDIQSGLPHGNGQIDYWMDNDCITASYDGEWDQGCWRHGTSILKCGDSYTGSFNQLHERHGEGEYVWKTEECDDGRRKERFYKGNFECNKRHGFGVFTWRTIFGEKENLSVYKGMYHHNKKQGHGVYSNQNLKYTGEWFWDKYHGMGRLEVFGQFIHRGNFRNGEFVAKVAVPPPFVLSSSNLDQRYIKKRHNVMAELAKRGKVGDTLVSEGKAKPQARDGVKKDYKKIAPQKLGISANDLLGAINKQRTTTAGPKQEIEKASKTNTVMGELSSVLSKRHEKMKAHEISSSPVARKTQGPKRTVNANPISHTNKPVFADIQRKDNLMAELKKVRKQSAPVTTTALSLTTTRTNQEKVIMKPKVQQVTKPSNSSPSKHQTLMNELNSKLSARNSSP